MRSDGRRLSSHELSRALGVTQKTAWFMLHRIREAMETGTFRKLQGGVVGRRITYRELCAIDDAGFMGKR